MHAYMELDWQTGQPASQPERERERENKKESEGERGEQRKDKVREEQKGLPGEVSPPVKK